MLQEECLLCNLPNSLVEQSFPFVINIDGIFLPLVASLFYLSVCGNFKIIQARGVCTKEAAGYSLQTCTIHDKSKDRRILLSITVLSIPLLLGPVQQLEVGAIC